MQAQLLRRLGAELAQASLTEAPAPCLQPVDTGQGPSSQARHALCAELQQLPMPFASAASSAAATTSASFVVFPDVLNSMAHLQRFDLENIRLTDAIAYTLATLVPAASPLCSALVSKGAAPSKRSE